MRGWDLGYRIYLRLFAEEEEWNAKYSTLKAIRPQQLCIHLMQPYTYRRPIETGH